MLCRPFRCECTFMIENGVLVRVQFEFPIFLAYLKWSLPCIVDFCCLDCVSLVLL